MKDWKVWRVVNRMTGEVLIEGRKRDCVNYWYPRWCYERKPLELVQTERLLVS